MGNRQVHARLARQGAKRRQTKPTMEGLEDRRVLAGWSGAGDSPLIAAAGLTSSVSQSPADSTSSNAYSWLIESLAAADLQLETGPDTQVGTQALGVVDGIPLGRLSTGSDVVAPVPAVPRVEAGLAGTQTRVWGTYEADPGSYQFSFQISRKQSDGTFAPYVELNQRTASISVAGTVAFDYLLDGPSAPGDRLRYFIARIGEATVEQSTTILLQSSVITGVTRTDVTHNGLTADDPPLGGETILLYQDNGDEIFNQDTLLGERNSDELGRYFFSNVPAGVYFVLLQTPDPSSVVAPTNPYLVRITGAAVNTDVTTGIDFSRSLLASIGGQKWWDENRNGVRDANEEGLPGQVIFLDANDNGQLDPTEQSTVTLDSSDDSLDGTYGFGEIPPGQYVVRELPSAGWRSTFPVTGGYAVNIGLGEQLTGLDFANTRATEFRGVKWLDVNGNLERDSRIAEFDILFVLDASDSMVALDYVDSAVGDFNGDGISGSKFDAELTALSLLAQDLAQSPIGAVADVGLVVFNQTANIIDLSPADAESLTTRLDSPARVASFRDNVLRSLRAQGQTSFTEALVESLAFFEQVGSANSRGQLVLMSDGIQFPVEGVPYLAQLEELRGRGIQLVARGIGSDTPLDHLRVIDPQATNFTNASDADGFFAGLTPGRIYSEPGLSQVTIYIDENNNGLFDPQLDEPAVQTAADNPLTLIDESGEFVFPVEGSGPFIVREVVPAGYAQVVPASPGCWIVTLSGEAATGIRCDDASVVQETIEFANRAVRRVGGNVWLDTNANQLRDNESGFRNAVLRLTGAGGETFELTPAADNPATVVDETGNFVFDGLNPGIYQLSILLGSDYRTTLPIGGTYQLDLRTESSVTRDFGVLLAGSLAGKVYQDFPPVGSNTTLLPLAGVDVYLDINGNGIWNSGEPVSRTDGDGAYTFNGLPSGAYRVAVRPVADTWQTLPGGFAAPVLVSPNQIVHPATAAGDLNGDGIDELIIVDDGRGVANSSGVTVAVRTGTGQFQLQSRIAVAGRAQRVLVTDWDSDGDADLVVAAVGSPAGGSPTTDGLTLLQNRGGGNLVFSKFLGLNGGTMDVVAADFNGDGRPDLAASQFVSRQVAVWTGDGGGNFNRSTNVTINGTPVALTAGDLNNDGRSDLVVGLADRGAVAVLRNLGPQSNQRAAFSLQTIELPTTLVSPFFVGTANDFPIANGNSGTADVALGDVNGDGLVDIAATVFGDNSVFVLQANENSQQFSITRQTTGNRPRGVLFTDVDADGDQDLLISAGEDRQIELLANLSAGFSPPVPILSGEHGQTIELVDSGSSAPLTVVQGNLFLGASVFQGRRPYYQVNLAAGANLESLDFHLIVLAGTTAAASASVTTAEVVAAAVATDEEEPVVEQPESNPLDVNRDGYVSPIDALLVINELNRETLSGTTESRSTNPSGRAQLDVNGDGFVSPIDALLVINWLNAPTPAPSPAVNREEVASSSAAGPVTPPVEVTTSEVPDETSLASAVDAALRDWEAERPRRKGSEMRLAKTA